MHPATNRRGWLLVLAALLLAAIPFVFLGAKFEDQLRDWFAQPWHPHTRFWLVVGLLSVDIFLPVPSSGVCTAAGAQLGIWPATLAGTLGMTIGAVAGYGLARSLGPPLASWMTAPDVQSGVASSSERGPVLWLVLSRPVPIFSEAAVLLAGLLPVSWWNFFWPVLLTNFSLALMYAVLGAWSAEQGLFWPALVVSLLAPLAVSLLLRRRKRSSQPAVRD